MKALRILDRGLLRAETALLVLLLGALVLLAFSQVVLRNAFGTGWIWADTIVRHLVLWSGFMGAALAAGQERHIGIDALTHFLPARIREAARSLTGLFAVTVCWILLDAALRFIADEKSSGSEIALSIPTWVALLIIPVGYGLVGVHFLVRAIEHGVQAASGRREA
ncbi:MAG: TRAP transporter small permease [Bacteroidota bacterium]